MRLVKFKKEHLECMEVREHEKQLITAISLLERAEQTSIAITAIHDGRVICCGGVSPYSNGNADIWLIPSIFLKDCPVSFARETKKWLFGVREDLCLSRMQTFCINDDFHAGWMRFLGFEKEGVMKKYHNGEDYSVWGRVWD